MAAVSFLAKARTGGKNEIEKCVIYSAPGGGKSTAAASFPKPIFLPIEDGLVALPHVARYDNDGKPWTWELVNGGVLDELVQVAGPKCPYKTLVIDTADALEPLCWEFTCRHNYEGKIWKSIESPGWGKGYGAALTTWRGFYARLEKIALKGMNIVVLAHSQVETFKNPKGPDFHRWQLKMDKKAAALLFESFSDVFFLQEENTVSVEKDTLSGRQRSRVRGGGVRFAYTTTQEGQFAKHRKGLPHRFEVPDPRIQSFYDTLLAERAAFLAGEPEEGEEGEEPAAEPVSEKAPEAEEPAETEAT